MWANSYFLVQEFQEDGGVIRLTVNTTSIGSFARSDNNAIFHQVVKSVVCGRHVSAFAKELSAVGNHVLSIFDTNIVLHSAGDV